MGRAEGEVRRGRRGGGCRGETTDLDELAGVCEGDAIRRSGRCHVHIATTCNARHHERCNMQYATCNAHAAVMRNVRQSVQPAITIRNARAVQRATRA